jgi:ABC-type lipoprotein export system ATPase subunit
MQIRLNKVIPAPMAGDIFDDSRIWAKSVELETSGRILVKADSGKGKSTLIAFIYGSRRDYTGSIELDGKNTSGLSLNELASCRQTKMSVVFQDLRLFANLTAGENIKLKYNLANGITEEEIKAMAEQMGMLSYLDQSCGTLSLGQQQRIAIIRALVQPFEFLLLDEPFSHLDKGNTEIAYALIRQRCEKQKAGMLITSLGEEYGVDFTQRLTV